MSERIERAPIKFKPYLKSVSWGGDRICKFKGIEQPEPRIGESWEISAMEGCESTVAEGRYMGMTIRELIDQFGTDFLGSDVVERYGNDFPLLIKFIDAHDNLSVQVHPNDELAAKRHGGRGKTEMWYIIDSEKDARIYVGLNAPMDPEEYGRRVAENSFFEMLAEHNPAPEDVFFLPAGRVHAIGAGNFLAEILQASDITYRIYDYNRRDEDGNYRELHTELAKDAIDFKVYPDYKMPYLPDDKDDCELISCEHFISRRILVDGQKEFHLDPSSFSALMCVKGEVDILYPEGRMKLKEGNTVLIPAIMKQFLLKGKGTILSVRSGK